MYISLFVSSLIPLLFCRLSTTEDVPSPIDDFKREMAISQFRKKLVDQLSDLIEEPVLIGANHLRNSKKNPTRHLKRTQRLRLTKTIFPGFNVNNCSADSEQCFEFLFPNSLLQSQVKSAKLIFYVESIGRQVPTWSIGVLNSPRTTMKIHRKLSNTKMQYFYITDIVKAFMDNFSDNKERPGMILGLRSPKMVDGSVLIKNILLMVSTKKAPKRLKRSAVSNQQRMCYNSSLYCCMQSFSVTPERLSLVNLISPEIIQLNYCKGECNNQISLQSGHAKMMAVLKSSKTSPLSARQLESMTSCCTPQKYSKMLVKYRDVQTQVLIEAEMNEMIVSKCGCY